MTKRPLWTCDSHFAAGHSAAGIFIGTRGSTLLLAETCSTSRLHPTISSWATNSFSKFADGTERNLWNWSLETASYIWQERGHESKILCFEGGGGSFTYFNLCLVNYMKKRQTCKISLTAVWLMTAQLFKAQGLAPGLVPFSCKKTVFFFLLILQQLQSLCEIMGTVLRVEKAESMTDMIGSTVHCN